MTDLEAQVKAGAKLVRNYARDEGEILTAEEVAQRIAARACQPLVEALEHVHGWAIVPGEPSFCRACESEVPKHTVNCPVGRVATALAAHKEGL